MIFSLIMKSNFCSPTQLMTISEDYLTVLCVTTRYQKLMLEGLSTPIKQVDLRLKKFSFPTTDKACGSIGFFELMVQGYLRLKRISLSFIFFVIYL